MSLADENNGVPATMLVGPTSVGNGYPAQQSGFGGFGGDMGWLILFLLLAGNGGWGGGFGGYGGVNGLAADGAMLYPWMNQSQQVNNGFRDQMINQNISDIQNGVNGLSTQLCGATADIQQSLCNGFAGVNSTINSNFANSETAANARQMANMQQAFANQTAMNQGFNGLQGQLAQCCCDNRLATAQTQALVQSENCADRAALSDGVRDIINNQTAGVQRILDKLCDSELQAERRENQNLRSELMYARGQASQIEQTAQIRAGQNASVNALVNELRSCPIPSQPVYGSQPIFSCPQNQNSCGCACGMA